MNINAEFAFYPFGMANFKEIVKQVIADLAATGLHITYNPVSTILFGESSKILTIVGQLIELYFSQYQVVLEVKLSNACPEPKE